MTRRVNQTFKYYSLGTGMGHGKQLKTTDGIYYQYIHIITTNVYSLSNEEPRPKPRPLPGYGSRSHRSTNPPLREETPQLITAEEVSKVRGGVH